MNNYIYCTVDSRCIHRRGCKRWVGNYNEEQQRVNKIHESETFDGDSCLEHNGDDYMKFDMLDRFRSSVGEDDDS